MMGNHWNDSNRSKMFDAIGLTFGTLFVNCNHQLDWGTLIYNDEKQGGESTV